MADTMDTETMNQPQPCFPWENVSVNLTNRDAYNIHTAVVASKTGWKIPAARLTVSTIRLAAACRYVKQKRQKLVKHKRDAEALSVYMSEPFPLIALISSPSSAPRKPTKQPKTSLLEETFSSKTEFSEGITRCMYEPLLIDNLTLKKELGSRDRLSAPTNTSRRVGQELRRLQGCIELWRSMTDERKTFCRITALDQDYYLLAERVSNDDLKLALSDGSNVWNGLVTGAEMKAWSRPLKMNYADFVRETTTAFTCDNVSELHFEYLVTPVDNSSDVMFVWKKCVPRESIKFQLGRVQLMKTDRQTAAFRQIFDCVLTTETDLRHEISALQSEKERLASERSRALQSLEKCVAAKEGLEKDMFSKFLVVINDKKAKIRELREEVETLQAGCVASTSKISSQTSSKRRHHAEDDTDSNSSPASNSEYDTDEENKAKVCQSKNRRLKSDGGDSSLILEDGDQDDSPTVCSRRFDGARQKRGKRGVVSKPTLPKVKTTKKEAAAVPETTKKPVYKVPSRRRSKSSQSTLDVDDLMADL